MVEVTPIEAQTLKKLIAAGKGAVPQVVLGQPSSDEVFIMPDLDG
jgi:hypothetical protein